MDCTENAVAESPTQLSDFHFQTPAKWIKLRKKFGLTNIQKQGTYEVDLTSIQLHIR